MAIIPTQRLDRGELVHRRFNKLPEETLRKMAHERLPALASQVGRRVLRNLTRYEGHVEHHPTEFMKLDLTSEKELYRKGDDHFIKRLHIWRRGSRQGEERTKLVLDGIRNGLPHSHDWWVWGMPIKLLGNPDDTYVDEILVPKPVSETELVDGANTSELWLPYRPDYEKPFVQELTPNGNYVRFRRAEQRRIEQGTIHEIPPGVIHHTTPITIEQLVVTVVLLSHRITGEGPDVYYFDAPNVINDERILASEQELADTGLQLESVLPDFR
jgi:hypothetical protein